MELRLDVPSIRGRLGSIEVRVHDAATQAPAAAATVVYERVDFGGSGVVKVSPETGSVRIEGVQPGAYLLFASADGYGEAGACVEVRLSARRGWPRESRT